MSKEDLDHLINRAKNLYVVKDYLPKEFRNSSKEYARTTTIAFVPHSWNEISRDMEQDLHTVTGKFDEGWLMKNGGVYLLADPGYIVVEHDGIKYRFRRAFADQFIKENNEGPKQESKEEGIEYYLAA